MVFNRDYLQLKKSLMVFNQYSLSFKNVLWYLIKTFHHLKKFRGIQSHLNFEELFNKLGFDGHHLKSVVVFKVIQISKNCLTNWVLMDFVGFSNEILG
jgi:hypothetical protein